MIYPVSFNTFKIDIGTEDHPNYVGIKNMTALNPSFDKTVETYFAFDDRGYQEALATGIAMSFTSEVKTDYSDPGNLSLHNTMFEIGEACNRRFEWSMPNGTVVKFTAVVAVDSVGGETTNIDTMNVTLTVKGKPVVGTQEIAGIGLTPSVLGMTEGDTATIVATLYPIGATGEVSWTSSDTSVATVSGGVVRALSAGTATIKATAGTHSDTCDLTVSAAE